MPRTITIHPNAGTPLDALVRLFNEHGDKVTATRDGNLVVGAPPPPPAKVVLFRPQPSIVGDGPEAA